MMMSEFVDYWSNGAWVAQRTTAFYYKIVNIFLFYSNGKCRLKAKTIYLDVIKTITTTVLTISKKAYLNRLYC